MARVCNLSTGEAKAAESLVQGQPVLFSKCEASLGYVGSCLTRKASNGLTEAATVAFAFK